jgi:hypothetical protein
MIRNDKMWYIGCWDARWPERLGRLSRLARPRIHLRFRISVGVGASSIGEVSGAVMTTPC